MGMPEIKALFWDVGGVLLSNAWDRTQRTVAFQKFHLDEIEFHDRHEMLVSSFERGKITLDEYLERTVFYRDRPFTREEFKNFVLSLSQPNPEALDFALALAKSRKYLMSTINNESKDLNLYRIDKFNLRAIFSLFVSSCYVGLRKPEIGIYQLALDITQQKPEESCFVDDRELNLESAGKLGMHPIKMENARQLQQALRNFGVQP
jgi:putative hydrolase of the HAD superfamily